jgi:hypothetical protein
MVNEVTHRASVVRYKSNRTGEAALDAVAAEIAKAYQAVADNEGRVVGTHELTVRHNAMGRPEEVVTGLAIIACYDVEVEPGDAIDETNIKP